ncbi:AAA family ATPase [Sorangium sp. So ce1182]|uniref:AAA family ATPase n=1 Tax=Sorangium sp. So ce1182 TaxID=3133334 RepID=UPI003F5DBC7C
MQKAPPRNPYVPGRRVTGQMFYGREAELSRLRYLLQDSLHPHHVQIVGEIRSGKSSLIAEFLRRHGDVHVQFVLVPLDLSAHFRIGTAQDFFRQLVEYISQAVESRSEIDEQLREVTRHLLPPAGLPSLQRLHRFFDQLERACLRVLLVLDEFDYSIELFKLDEQAFKYLRHMADNFAPLTLVTSSRRSIFDIECDAGMSSNLAGVMPEHIYVSLLEPDAARLLCREPAQHEGVIWEHDVVELMVTLSGCHPCLIQRLARHLFFEARESPAVERIAMLTHAAPRIFGELFDDMERRLRKFGLWSAIVELVRSGDRFIEHADRDRLERFGYIVVDKDGHYRTFTPLLDHVVNVRADSRMISHVASAVLLKEQDGAFEQPETNPRVGDETTVASEAANPTEQVSTAAVMSPASAIPPARPNLGSVEGGAVVNDAANDRFDVAIVCALRTPELKKVLDTGTTPWRELDSEPDDPATYHGGFYTTLKGTVLRVVAAAPSQMGMPATAVLTAKMVRRFRPKLVAMVGIAAGVSGGGRGFGDILAPDCTFDYGAGKWSSVDNKLHFSPDPNPINIVPVLRSRLKDWELKGERLARIRERWQDQPADTVLRLHVGPLGSGAAVVSAQQPVATVRDHWRKLIGIEMEAYGAHLACQEVCNPPPMFLCMKSVCDFADPEKKDDWQHYAAYTAAQLCQVFLVEEWDRLFPR